MARITFITRDNETVTIEGTGGTLMKLAKENGVKGIDGECGGVMSCATCHVHVEPEHFDKVGEAGEMEKDLLELNDHSNQYSRLCCQIEVSEELDGMVVKVAERDY
jgi:2Fe-2S ferredoxin